MSGNVPEKKLKYKKIQYKMHPTDENLYQSHPFNFQQSCEHFILSVFKVACNPCLTNNQLELLFCAILDILPLYTYIRIYYTVYSVYHRPQYNKVF